MTLQNLFQPLYKDYSMIGYVLGFLFRIARLAIATVVYAILLIGRWRLGWRGRPAIHWTLGGFMLLLLAYFGSKFVLEILLGRV